MNQTKVISNRREMLFNFLLAFAAIAFLTTVTMYAFPAALADGAADSVIDTVIMIMQIITNVVGILFAIIRIVKCAMSHANEDGPAQQKAVMMMATGIVLIILGTVVLNALKPTIKGWLTTVPTTTG